MELTNHLRAAYAPWALDAKNAKIRGFNRFFTPVVGWVRTIVRNPPLSVKFMVDEALALAESCPLGYTHPTILG